MMLTELEASKKVCPLLQLAMMANHGDEFSAGSRNCFASGCLMWRYRPHPADDQWIEAVRKAAEELGDATPNRAKAAKHVSQNREKFGLPIVPTHGWCGLAGRPE